MQEDLKYQEVISYYNDHVQHKLNDFIEVNPRIEAAWKTLKEFAPASVMTILEIGCGIGAITNRLNKRWPEAAVEGIDISTLSIQIASKLFSNSKTKFQTGVLKQDTFNEQFDLIVLMDVYEHISADDRIDFHASLRKNLKNKGRIFLSVPSPHYLRWLEKHKQDAIQPVDEYITLDVVSKLATDTGTEVVKYELKNIWSTGDYAHIVLEKNEDFEAAFFKPKPVTIIERSIRILSKGKNKLGSFLRRMYVRFKIK